MDWVPVLIIGAIAGFVTGSFLGGPGTGYLASIVVGVAGTLLGVSVNNMLGITGAGGPWVVLVLALLGSTAVRLVMLAAAASRRLAVARRG